MSNQAITHVNDDQFDAEVLKSSEPVLVDELVAPIELRVVAGPGSR